MDSGIYLDTLVSLCHFCKQVFLKKLFVMMQKHSISGCKKFLYNHVRSKNAAYMIIYIGYPA
ncbi:hypothetical protein HMPREF0326_01376 [Desulfovibrio sp. 3_1_syn3]|nr:hypothetical protein HMPREF0326_01376 [Desulfovibrio sp. 3_1_syn3]